MYALVYVTWHFGVLAIIEQYRIGFLYYMSAAMVVIIPLDLVFSFLQKHHMPKLVLKGLSVCALVGIVVTVVQTGNYHSYLYYELIRYDSVVQVTNKIIDNLPEKSFTIVSPTEELYQVIEYGWHEELLDFILGQKEEDYTWYKRHIKGMAKVKEVIRSLTPFWLYVIIKKMRKDSGKYKK